MSLVRRYILTAALLVLGMAASAFAFHYYYTITHSMATRYPTADGTTTGWRKSNADSTHWRSVNEVNTKEVPVDFWYWNRIRVATARVDTFLPDKIGHEFDSTEVPWSKSSTDSTWWALVNENPANDADYWWRLRFTAGLSYVGFDVDTTILGPTLDSVRILVRAKTTATGNDSIAVWKYIGTTATACDTLLATITNFTTDVSRAITGLTRAQLKAMEVGVTIPNLIGSGKYDYVSWIALQVFSTTYPVAGDSLAVTCFTDPGVDTTYLTLDSVRFGIRATHTGAGYKRLIVMADTSGQTWNLDTIDARGNRDTLYVSADGDTNQWVGSTSPNYTNVDERVPSSSDYVSPTLGDPLSEQYRIEGDSAHAATLDSIRILAWLYNPNGSGDTAYVQMRHNIGGWTILDTAKIPTAYGAIYKVSRAIATPSKAQMMALQIGFTKIVNGVSVRLRWCAVERFFSDNIYHMEYTRPVVNLSKATLNAMQIGVKQIDTCDTGESLKVAQITTQVYTSDIGTYDYARRIYHDSSDFVIGQISNRGGRDDQWGKAFPEVGRTQTQGTGTDSSVTNRAFLVIRNLDSIINAKPGSCPKEYSVDSAFLYLTCTETNNSVKPLQFRHITPAVLPTFSRTDSCFPNANGTTLEWDKSNADSAYWQCVNEAVANDAEGWYTNISTAECFVDLDVDTTKFRSVIDSVGFILRSGSGEIEEYTIVIEVDTSGVVFNLDSLTDDGARFYYDFRTRGIAGLTKLNLTTLQVGVRATVSSGALPTVNWLFMIVYSSDADTTLCGVYSATGTKVAHRHSNWVNYDTALVGPVTPWVPQVEWLLGGADSTEENNWPVFVVDTITLSTGVTSKIDITRWLQTMRWSHDAPFHNALCLRMTGDNPDSTTPNVFYELANVRPFTSGEEDSSWIEIFTSYVGECNDPDPTCMPIAQQPPNEGQKYNWEDSSKFCIGHTSSTTIDGDYGAAQVILGGFGGTTSPTRLVVVARDPEAIATQLDPTLWTVTAASLRLCRTGSSGTLGASANYVYRPTIRAGTPGTGVSQAYFGFPQYTGGTRATPIRTHNQRRMSLGSLSGDSITSRAWNGGLNMPLDSVGTGNDDRSIWPGSIDAPTTIIPGTYPEMIAYNIKPWIDSMVSGYAPASRVVTLGYPTRATSQQTFTAAIYYLRVQAKYSGTIDSIGASLNFSSGAGDVKFALYSWRGVLLDSTAKSTIPSGTNKYVCLASQLHPTITAGSFYSIAVRASSTGTIQYLYFTGRPSDSTYQVNTAWSAQWPSTSASAATATCTQRSFGAFFSTSEKTIRAMVHNGLIIYSPAKEAAGVYEIYGNTTPMQASNNSYIMIWADPVEEGEGGVSGRRRRIIQGEVPCQDSLQIFSFWPSPSDVELQERIVLPLRPGLSWLPRAVDTNANQYQFVR